MSLRNAVEKENKIEMLKYLDRSYEDMYGMIYEEFVTTVDNFFEQFDTIKVSMSGLEINIDSTKANVIFASCSLGLKVFAKYEGDKVIVFGGVIKPSPVRAFLKKSNKHYKIYRAEY
jgi:hypothetical protein